MFCMSSIVRLLPALDSSRWRTRATVAAGKLLLWL